MDNTIRIKQPTKQGYIEVVNGGLIDINYPSSTTRRGRTQGGGTISPTITTDNVPCQIRQEGDNEMKTYRIRKLTPKECFRLMGYRDSDYEKASSVVSSTQAYKQAGNAIAENCLVAIFGQMFEGKEDVYKSISRNPDGSRKENYFDDGKADAN